jgi:cell division protein FtsL
MKGKKKAAKQPREKEEKQKKKRKKLTVSKKAMAVILVVIGVGAFAVSYGYLRPELVSQGEELQKQNDQLNVQMTRLNELEQNQESYIQQTAVFQTQNQAILDKFPPETREEDAILYAKEIEDESDFWINLISLEPGNLLYATGVSDTAEDGTAAASSDDEEEDEDDTDTTTTANDTADTGETASSSSSSGYDLGIIEEADVQVPNYQLYDMAATYDFTASYEYMKKMVEKIQTDPEKRNVNTISLTYDETTGQLLGSMTVNLYYLTGTEKEYEVPDAGKIKKGKDNLFDTIKSKKE